MFNCRTKQLHKRNGKYFYIFYDLDAWPPRNPTNNFKFKSCLFGATSVVKNSDREKYVHSGYGIIFHSAGFNNDNARNNIIFGIDNNSSIISC